MRYAIIIGFLGLSTVPAAAQDFISSGVSSPMTLVPLGGYHAGSRIGMQAMSDVRIGDRFGLLADHPVADRWSISLGALAGEHLARASDSTGVEESGFYAAFGASAWRSFGSIGHVELSAGAGINADVFSGIDAARLSVPVAVSAAVRIPVGPLTLVPATTVGVAARFDDLEATRSFANDRAWTGASHFGWFLSLAPRLELGRVWLEARMDRSKHLASDSMGKAVVYYEQTPPPSYGFGDGPEHVVHAGYSLGLRFGLMF